MVDVLGLVAVIVFYLLILGVGIWAGRKQKAAIGGGGPNSEEVMLAGRNIGTVVGIFTMTGTYGVAAYKYCIRS
jgi:solute carrier family 5 (high affinity choline transporter), member 7